MRPIRPIETPHRGAWSVVAGLLVLGLLATGCSRPTKHDLLSQTEDVHSSGELEAKIGKPDDREVLAMFEQWTYDCSDGVVVFHVAQGKIIFRTTHEKGEKPKQGDTE